MKNAFAFNTKTGELDGKRLIIREIDESLSKRQGELVEKGGAGKRGKFAFVVADC